MYVKLLCLMHFSVPCTYSYTVTFKELQGGFAGELKYAQHRIHKGHCHTQCLALRRPKGNDPILSTSKFPG